MSSRVSLSGLDSAFLSLETPSAPMNVVGTLVLDASSPSGACSYERVLRLVEERAPRLAPFRRRMVAMPFGLDHPVWVDDPAPEVRSHVHRVRAPAPGSDRVLADPVDQLLALRHDAVSSKQQHARLGFGAAVGHLLKLALERTSGSLPVGGEGAKPDPDLAAAEES